MSREEEVFEQLKMLSKKQVNGATARDVSELLHINRSTASRYLNELVKYDKAYKLPGKPVKYIANAVHKGTNRNRVTDSGIIGVNNSLKALLDKGLAALLYPSQSLHILLSGETGTGKTYLAETLHQTAVSQSLINSKTPFIVFNCANYAQNADLLVGQIFGIKKGAYTGADRHEAGLVEQADGGILFLDEIHRLPPSGQEMLFYLIDKGVYSRFGESIRERKADVTLIGATTEQPEQALLSTLLRRFSEKMTLPPLRDRGIEEKEWLLDNFLREEADKMETQLSIQRDCRIAFLSYSCPGNVGQFKSDVQIACARAFLRYINEDESQVTIQEEDLPEEVSGYLLNRNNKPQQVKSVKTSHNNTPSKQLLLPNIYRKLNERNTSLVSHEDPRLVEQELKQVVNQYIQDLMKNYQTPHSKKQSLKKLMDGDLLEALQEASNQLKESLPTDFNTNQLYVIGLHLQNYRKNMAKERFEQPLPSISNAGQVYREAAQQLAGHLYKELEWKLPSDEVELIAHFLTPIKQPYQEKKIAVIVVTHGYSTASSMSEVANTLLGAEVVHGIDMPLDVSASETYQQVISEIQKNSQYIGVLLLVDIGSLVTMGDTMQYDLNIPVKTLSSINLPMVIEAGRRSLAQENTLDDIYFASKKAMYSFIRSETEKDLPKKKRLIVTVCFTGEGASQLLEEWIGNQLSKDDYDVVVRSVRVDPLSRDMSILKTLKDYYDIIAIIGTVPLSMDEVPYIPAWELLKEEGASRLFKLLELTRFKNSPSPSPKNNEIDSEKDFELMSKGLGEIVTCLNPKTFCSILHNFMTAIKEYYHWDSDRELGMWMHIGALIDRIILGTLNDDLDNFLSTIPVNHESSATVEEQEVWEPLFNKLEQTFHIHLEKWIKKEIIDLSH